jgi:hypothetical protein
MVLAHHRRQPPVPAAMQIAEATVTVALRMNGAVFLPEQVACNASRPGA